MMSCSLDCSPICYVSENNLKLLIYLPSDGVVGMYYNTWQEVDYIMRERVFVLIN